MDEQLPRSDEPHAWEAPPVGTVYCRARVLDADTGKSRYCWEKADDPIHVPDEPS